MIAGSSTLDSAGETILIVEDEVLIRFDVADYLRTCGYRVIEAANATEAIAVLQSGRRIDLVFSDVQLPGSMDGFALARWVRAHQPEIKVILVGRIALCRSGRRAVRGGAARKETL